MLLLAVDVETSGPCVKKNFMIELGAALVDLDLYDPADPTASVVARFGSYIKRPLGGEWDNKCLKEFWMNHKMVHPDKFKEVQTVIKNPETPTEDLVGYNFIAWLESQGCRGSRPFTLVTDNPAFDFVWLQRILPPGEPLLYLSGGYGSDPIDTNSFYAGFLGMPAGDPGSVSSRMRVNFKHIPRGTPHVAADDAAHMAMMLAHASKIMLSASSHAAAA